MCDCIERIEKALLDHFKAERVDLKLVCWSKLDGSANRYGLPPLHYTAYIKGPKGGTKMKKNFVPFTYCPFCGQRYHDEKESPRTALEQTTTAK